MGLKIAVLGGASSYTPELFAGLLRPDSRLTVDEVALLDLDATRLELVARVSRRLVEAADRRLTIHPTLSTDEVMDGADFVILQIRVGGAQARIRDETLPMRFGMVGNETTGPGGFICALRTVPVALAYARALERIAPKACLLNLTNPAGIVTEALLNHSSLRTLGFCNIPINLTTGLAEALDVSTDRMRIEYFGLNHLGWVPRAYLDGREVLGRLLAEARNRQATLYRHELVDPLVDPEWLRVLGMIPNWYCRYYYYPEQVLEEDRRSEQTDGQRDITADEHLRRIYQRTGYDQQAREILAAKGGAQYYEPVLRVIDAIVHDTGALVVADVQNGGALPDLPAGACVEVPARFRRERTEPVPVGPMPISVRGLVQAVKAYEELAIEAALIGDSGIAVAALVAHPLCGSYPKAKAFLDSALEAEGTLLPQFAAPRTEAGPTAAI
jgi:6-phospho-beta-glucosidase